MVCWRCAIAVEAHSRPSSSVTSAQVGASASAPPQRAAIRRSISPTSRSMAQFSRGKNGAASARAAFGRSTSAATVRARSR